MPVPVFGTDADERHARAQATVELGVLVGAAMMRDLDHVDGRDVDASEERLLGVLAQVAEQHGPRKAGAGDVEGDARVVAGLRLRCGTERLPVRGPDFAGHAEGGGRHGSTRGGERVEESLIGGFAHRSVQDRGDPPDQCGCPTDVVAVEVGEQKQIDAVDTEGLQTGRDRFRVLPRVDERGGRPRAPQRRVALPHVAHRHLPVRRHGEGTGHRAHRRLPEDEPGDQGDDKGRAGRESGQPARCDHMDGDRRPDEGEQARAEDAVGPREVLLRDAGGGVGDGGDPRRGDPSEPGEAVAQPRDRRDAGERARDRRGRGRRVGEHVRGHAEERDVRVDEHDERAAGELGRRGHGDRQGEGTRHPSLETGGQGPRQEQ
ncbi:hypothetical protein Q9R20_13405 [Microbacterium sp. PRF11]|nr:hypothetical protein [Microbacterium sp. PRF11]MDT0117981.1 hypothetical protein [Microbacterium sp. PRF11]